jgi:hypothetical protein
VLVCMLARWQVPNTHACTEGRRFRTELSARAHARTLLHERTHLIELTLTVLFGLFGGGFLVLFDLSTQPTGTTPVRVCARVCVRVRMCVSECVRARAHARVFAVPCRAVCMCVRAQVGALVGARSGDGCACGCMGAWAVHVGAWVRGWVLYLCMFARAHLPTNPPVPHMPALVWQDRVVPAALYAVRHGSPRSTTTQPNPSHFALPFEEQLRRTQRSREHLPVAMFEIIRDSEVDVAVAHKQLSKFLENDAQKDASGCAMSVHTCAFVRLCVCGVAVRARVCMHARGFFLCPCVCSCVRVPMCACMCGVCACACA